MTSYEAGDRSSSSDGSIAAIFDCLASGKRALGEALARVCIGAPKLEDSMSLIAIAQSELGQARILSGLSVKLAANPEPHTTLVRAPTQGEVAGYDDFPCVDDWFDVIAALVTFDLGMQEWIEHFGKVLPMDALRKPLSRLAEEERSHEGFTRSALSELQRTGVPAAPLVRSVRRVRRRYAEWERDLVELIARTDVGGLRPRAVRRRLHEKMTYLQKGKF